MKKSFLTLSLKNCLFSFQNAKYKISPVGKVSALVAAKFLFFVGEEKVFVDFLKLICIDLWKSKISRRKLETGSQLVKWRKGGGGQGGGGRQWPEMT